MSLPSLKAPKGWKRAGHMCIKGVTERFGFDIVESRKFKQLVKNKATGTSHGMFIYSPHWIFAFLVIVLWVCFIYSSAWGFQRCSFRLTGQCESLTMWNEHQDWLHAFLYPCRNPIKSENVLYGATRRHNFRCGAECVLYKIGVGYTFNNHK